MHNFRKEVRSHAEFDPSQIISNSLLSLIDRASQPRFAWRAVATIRDAARHLPEALRLPFWEQELRFPMRIARALRWQSL